LAKKHLRVSENSGDVIMTDPFVCCREANIGPFG
jgi:hypothetical protein